MNTLPIEASYLLLIGSIALTVFIVQLPLLIKDYLHKRRRKKEMSKIIFVSADAFYERNSEAILTDNKPPKK
ncbi:hypothetical protein NL87_12545 [Salmonella enterica]|nr:hypothetical protein [Salmonella enterica subsp. enterica]EAW9008720.1 hypothetical protein [Salmonella enterica]EAY5637819.1 hypothetical protein [Salmonella enterica]EBP3786119.1 hypothetical protein [Salmonella enterica subsp. enterica]EBP3795774.1 hypothetical protein [Salmonella enterica subsp. enterica]